MFVLKNLFSSLILFFSSVIIATFVLTLLSYFSLLGPGIVSILKLLIPLFSIAVAGYRLGKQSEKRGYIEGIKIGTLAILSFLVLVLLLDKFTIKSLLYYLIILLTAILSSMIGINKKKLDT